MKKSTFILVIIALEILVVAMTVVSCKKDNENVMNSKTETSRAFNPRQIEDMNAYLQDFKK